jgi:diaminopimelate epimerase
MSASVLRFEKWEGLGNDFIVVSAEESPAISPERARELCDRRRGIGADGVLVVEAKSGAAPRMIVWNADGSRPEMCGNGLRCVAAYLARRRGESSGSAGGAVSGSAGGREILIATDSGEKLCLVRGGGGSAAAYDVTIAMGTARLDGEIGVVVDGREHKFLAVDVGNPHAISFEAYDESAFDRVAPVVATTPSGGTNVEVCRVEATEKGTRIEVVVWERGVGRTLACGTGACAVAAAACATGRAPFGSPIVVGLPGGDLEVTVGAERRDLVMRGEARRVFAGELSGP